jgi:hypothetical protein
MNRQKSVIISSVILLLIASGLIFFLWKTANIVSKITNYDECSQAGGTIKDNEPYKCIAPDGTEYIQDSSDNQAGDMANYEPAQCQDLNFEDYAVADIYKDKVSPVDFASDYDARKFREQILLNSKKGPNFAGHFTVAKWNCGTACQQYAVIDSKNGKIIEFESQAKYDIDYKIDNRILTVNPYNNLSLEKTFPADAMTRYFVLNETPTTTSMTLLCETGYKKL